MKHRAARKPLPELELILSALRVPRASSTRAGRIPRKSLSMLSVRLLAAIICASSASRSLPREPKCRPIPSTRLKTNTASFATSSGRKNSPSSKAIYRRVTAKAGKFRIRMKLDIEFNSGAQLPMDTIPGLALLAESHGFDCAWGGEANNKDPTVMLSAIAAVTSRLKIGSAIYHIRGRTPATLALQAVGLDELSGGRFLLGIGSSNPTIAKWHGQSLDRPLGRVEEYVEIVRAAMRGEKLSFAGKFFSAQNFKMAFKPSGRAIPIYLAAFGPKMTRLAGGPPHHPVPFSYDIAT